MSSKPALRDIRIMISAECALCGDILFTRPKNKDCTEAKEDLDHVFDTHLSLKHHSVRRGELLGQK